MLGFQTAAETSFEAFLAVSAGSTYQRQLEGYAVSLLDQKCTRQDWCVIGFEDDVPVARAALWSLPGEDVPSDSVLIEADWTEPGIDGGSALLAHVHELAAAHGSRDLQHHVDSPPGPPQYQEHESERTR